MRWFANHSKRSGRRLQKQILDLESQLAAAGRTIAVTESERDAMAEVIARDRMRVAAETAIAARGKAEAEGANERTDPSTR